MQNSRNIIIQRPPSSVQLHKLKNSVMGRDKVMQLSKKEQLDEGFSRVTGIV
jgi:hypothetical protein